MEKLLIIKDKEWAFAILIMGIYMVVHEIMIQWKELVINYYFFFYLIILG